MSQQTKLLSFRMFKSQIEEIKKILELYSKEKGLNKRDTLYRFIVESNIRKPEDRAFEAYKKAMTQASEAYNKSIALEAYKKAVNQAWEIYKKDMTQASEAYEKTMVQEIKI